jgi:membrane protein
MRWLRRLFTTIGRVLYRVWELDGQVHMGLIAAGVAFFGIFSIFPALAAIIAVFGLVSDPELVLTQLALLNDLIPKEAYDLIYDQVTRLLGARSDTLGWTTGLSLLIALWSARAGVGALVEGIAAIHGTSDRNGFVHALLAIALTLALLAIAVAALLIVVVAPIVLTLMKVHALTGQVLEWFRWGLALFILMTALGLLYRFSPSAGPYHRRRWVTPGAFAVVLMWIGVSFGLSYYLANFGSYNEVYGSIGAVIALLMWLYLSAYLVLLGAALNLVLAEEQIGKRPRYRRYAD